MGGWWLPRLAGRRGVLVLRDFWWRSLHTPSAGSVLLSNLNSLWQLLGNFFSYVWRRRPLTAAARCCVCFYGETAISPNPLHSCGWPGKTCMPASADGIIWGSFAGMITQVGKNQTFTRETVNFLQETPLYFQAIIPQPSSILKWVSRFSENLNKHN